MIAIQQNDKQVNTKALLLSIGVHVLLLLLFFLLKYTITETPPAVESGGLEVNLGTSNNGSGNNQPMSKKDPVAYQATVVYKSTAPARSSIPKDLVRSNEADAPEVNESKKKMAKAQANDQPKKPVVRQQPRYVYAGGTGAGGNSANQDAKGSNEGNTTGPGDRGVPGGTPGASNYTGAPGNGTGGIGHTLTGRDITPKKFEAEFREGGKVVIHVTVDRNGAIINKRVISSPSRELTQIAIEKLSNAHFSKSEGSEPEQSGDVTFYFKTRQ
jgi:outer membrane biosynthesis protein TonB